MNDPHVEWLIYRVVIPEGFEYVEPAPVEWPTSGFRALLEGEMLTVHVQEHFSSGEEARLAVNPALRAWEIASGLSRGRAEIEFVYSHAHLVDRHPPPTPPGTITGTVSMAAPLAQMSAFGTVVSRRDAYPTPPVEFAWSPDVEALWTRWQGYLDDREPLSSMGYFCLTQLERSTGERSKDRRAAAASKYRIDLAVLRTLGDLVSDFGDEQTGRKAHVKHVRPHTQRESAWLRSVVPALIRRAGEAAHDPQREWPILTMNAFPDPSG